MVDVRLYAIVDPQRAGGRLLTTLARSLAEGGATLVQLRDKRASTRALVALAQDLKAVLAPLALPLIVNDRVDVALAAGVDGVHLGQEDMEPTLARRLLGPTSIVGLSVKTLAQAQVAPIEVLDYIFVGGVFATGSKANPDPPIGLSGFSRLRAALRARAPGLPVGAIAGIDASNAAGVIAAGADGIAVISALSLAPDVVTAARHLRAIVDAGRCPGTPS
jgi:thiamine-phosphate pyrophosphorylase